MTVSVIIPVYNAGKTLPASLDSIKDQTYRHIQVVAVDDCSDDCSLQILEHFRDSIADDGLMSIRICRHEVNRGVACARNTGLENATGDYVCFVDADDAITPDAIEKAVGMAEKQNADIVGWDWTLCSGSERYMRQADCNAPETALKKLMSGVMRWNLWLFMARRSLYDNVRFLPGQNMGEDMMVMMKLMMKADAVAQIHEALYRYSQTEYSISRAMSDANIAQVSANVEEAERALLGSGYRYLAIPFISFLKQNIKLPLLVTGNKDDYGKWRTWFRESDAHIMENKALPLRTRLLQLSASLGQWWLVCLYNILIYKFLYKTMYR